MERWRIFLRFFCSLLVLFFFHLSPSHDACMTLCVQLLTLTLRYRPRTLGITKISSPCPGISRNGVRTGSCEVESWSSSASLTVFDVVVSGVNVVLTVVSQARWLLRPWAFQAITCCELVSSVTHTHKLEPVQSLLLNPWSFCKVSDFHRNLDLAFLYGLLL